MRPKLNKAIKPEEFRNFYWLKEELIGFCKSHGLPRSGGKQEITDRIHHFLKTGTVLKKAGRPTSHKSGSVLTLSLDAKIPKHYKSDEAHRRFFKQEIGEHFKFNVIFMNWMKANAGKTYKTAVKEWTRIHEEKKSGKKHEISSQFEYNQYTRDFYRDNPDRPRADVIACWKYKKSLPGSNKYESKDLECL